EPSSPAKAGATRRAIRANAARMRMGGSPWGRRSTQRDTARDGWPWRNPLETRDSRARNGKAPAGKSAGEKGKMSVERKAGSYAVEQPAGERRCYPCRGGSQAHPGATYVVPRASLGCFVVS